jgi:hypothetical protein
MPENTKCTLDANVADCTCTYEPCPRKGKCCECLRYHWRRRELPGCLFPPEVERTYDRSLAAFIRAHSRG